MNRFHINLAVDEKKLKWLAVSRAEERQGSSGENRSRLACEDSPPLQGTTAKNKKTAKMTK